MTCKRLARGLQLACERLVNDVASEARQFFKQACKMLESG